MAAWLSRAVVRGGPGRARQLFGDRPPQLLEERNTALAAKADAIVTGDDDLLVLKKHHGIRILSPRQFLELIGP